MNLFQISSIVVVICVHVIVIVVIGIRVGICISHGIRVCHGIGIRIHDIDGNIDGGHYVRCDIQHHYGKSEKRKQTRIGMFTNKLKKMKI